MAKISLAGFKDPVRRPRYIIWTGVAVLVLAAVMIVALGVTSTRWFCSEGCHKVQDDTIIAYQHSSHSEISCMACHMPVNANPIVFILHKAEALGELYLTVTDNYELPLNAESEVSLTMTSDKCTQCHNLENRIVTPSPGIKIDHKPHEEINAACPVCHNRVAHREDFELTLTDPATGEPNKKHENFMGMTACFRCHGLEKGAPAPGACAACHPADFQLKPPSHLAAGFYPEGHAKLADAEIERAAEVRKEFGIDVITGERKAEITAGESENAEGTHESIGEELPPVGAIVECYTCHTESFCTDCHGMAMPHPAEFKEPKDPKDPQGHPAASKTQPKKCVMCHGVNEKTHFCDSCHHGTAVEWEFNAAEPWTAKQHPKAVAKSGVASCTEKCHTAKFCVDCHTSKAVLPSSHKTKNWVRPKQPTMTVYGSAPASPSADHALEAQKSIESCAVCHGEGGPNAQFCKSCHVLEMPHPAEFKEFHSKSKADPKPCVKCHTWPELCSNCHHVGSSTKTSWIKLHGSSVNKNGSASCLEKCHKKDFCVKCHQSRKVVPTSHKAKNFVRNYSTEKAVHVAQYTANGETCTNCHTGEAAALPNSKFCNGCHKLTMPHPEGFGAKGKGNGGEHQKLFNEKKTTKRVCANCHQPAFCNSCHHEGAPADKPWVRYHPDVVKKSGAQPCFDCHEETYCSNCHVNLAARGLLD